MAAPLVVVEDVDISNEEEIDEQASYSLATLPAKCEASGAGLAEAIVRQETFFDIKACDGRGQPKEHGGDAFFVSIRGCGVRVRARVIDNRDGSYTVRYKPEISGSYAVAISLYGDSLPGSPFLLRASTPTAVASECVLRGEALHLAIARTQQHFEVSFRDATGQVAHAEELDVYVELAEEEPNKQEALNSAPRESEHRETENKRERRDSKTLRSSRAAHVAAAAAADAEKGQSATAASSLGTMTAHERNFWLKRIPPLPTKQTKPRSADRDIARECVVTSKSPLIVRSDLALNSERLCQLLPGRRIYLLDMKHEDSVTRALAAVDLEDDIEEELVSTARLWQETYGSRPHWLTDSRGSRRGQPSLPHSPRMRRAPVGWVTVSKDGRGLVTPSCQLTASDRQLHMQAWARRLALDRSLDAAKVAAKAVTAREMSAADRRRSKSRSTTGTGRAAKNLFKSELESDPSGVGFAFGGVEPGRLHAHGKVVEQHKVYYSIGLVGTYRLHVGLRQQQMPLPGSPFKLVVVAGAAHASSTVVPDHVTYPILGTVGIEEEKGCTLLLPVRDRMGNVCHKGGAKVACSCSLAHVEAASQDVGNGTYKLIWRSERSGTFEVHVTIDGEQIESSPFNIKLMCDTPDLSKTDARGDGLREITAGGTGRIELQLHDKFMNIAVAGPSVVFGLTIVHQKENKARDKEEVKKMQNRWRTERSDRFQGTWLDEAYEIVFQPSFAGEQELFLWCSEDSGQRVLLAESPYRVFCTAGDAHAVGSSLDGFSIEESVAEKSTSRKERRGSVAGEPPDRRSSIFAETPDLKAAVSSVRSEARAEHRKPGSTISAGDMMLLSPVICDQYGNPASANDSPLTLLIMAPTGEQPLEVTSQLKAGLTSYQASYEPRIQGQYSARCMLAGTEIKGSPMAFEVVPAIPDVNKSILTLPQPPLYATYQGKAFNYTVTLRAIDRFNNKAAKGGAIIIARYGGNSIPQGQETEIEVQDLGDGTYSMDVNCKSPADLKLIIMVARERATNVVSEFSPISLNFLNRGAALMKEEREAKRTGQGPTENLDAKEDATKKSKEMRHSKENLAKTEKAVESASNDGAFDRSANDMTASAEPFPEALS